MAHRLPAPTLRHPPPSALRPPSSVLRFLRSLLKNPSVCSVGQPSVLRRPPLPPVQISLNTSQIFLWRSLFPSMFRVRCSMLDVRSSPLLCYLCFLLFKFISVLDCLPKVFAETRSPRSVGLRSAEAHEVSMRRDKPPFIGDPWTTAIRRSPLLGFHRRAESPAYEIPFHDARQYSLLFCTA